MADKLQALVINLDRDAARMSAITKATAGTRLEVMRLSAVNGAALPDALLDFVPGTKGAGKGTLGCFLSHARAWQTIRDTGMPYALILEDDAVILPEAVAVFDPVVQAMGDLCFVNDRMTCLDIPGEAATADVTVAIASRSTSPQIACGGDGYLLSANGAAKLLSVVGTSGFWGDVDWFILYAALGMSGIARMTASDTFKKKLAQMHKHYQISEPVIEARAAYEPFARHGRFMSSRLSEDRRGKESAEPGPH